MNFMAFLQSALYVISESLLYPVMTIILILFCLVIFRSGEIFAEGLRRRTIKIPEPADASSFFGPAADVAAIEATAPAVRKFLKEVRSIPDSAPKDVHVAYRLQESEERMNWELGKIRRLIRLGPMLGLMATLIPMGQALAALTEGEMQKMANSMIIAFTATVVGLFIAGVSFVLSQYKARWISEDRRAMELLAEVLVAGRDPRPR